MAGIVYYWQETTKIRGGTKNEHTETMVFAGAVYGAVLGAATGDGMGGNKR